MERVKCPLFRVERLWVVLNYISGSWWPRGGIRKAVRFWVYGLLRGSFRREEGTVWSSHPTPPPKLRNLSLAQGEAHGSCFPQTQPPGVIVQLNTKRRGDQQKPRERCKKPPRELKCHR